MQPDARLETYWITFPQDINLPIGLGVTAYSEEDAFALIQERGFDQWYVDATEILVTVGLSISDLDQSNVVPNIGPMQLREVWYPAANVGFGAPRDPNYKPPKT